MFPCRIGKSTRGPFSASQFIYDAAGMISISVRTANLCIRFDRVTGPKGVRSTAPMLPSVMPVRSKRSVPPVIKGVSVLSLLPRGSISNGCGAITKRTPIRKRCASAKCGWNRSLRKPKTGMACVAFACGCSGGSICEALRIAAGQNLKRLLNKRGWGRRPFPAEALCAFF